MGKNERVPDDEALQLCSSGSSEKALVTGDQQAVSDHRNCHQKGNAAFQQRNSAKHAYFSKTYC